MIFETGRRLRGGLTGFGLAVFVVLAAGGLAPQAIGFGPALAQSQTAGGGGATEANVGDLDYPAWEKLATAIEALLVDPTTTAQMLESRRAELVVWRDKLAGAQSANSSRIETLNQQIAALGPVPAEGASEAGELATRRSALTAQLAELQAPGITAGEAYRRANGLISEIDRILRELQAVQLLQLYPTPLNPVIWSEGYTALRDFGMQVSSEVTSRWQLTYKRNIMTSNLPLIILLTVVAVALLSFGRGAVEALTRRIANRWTARRVHILTYVLSVGQIIAPTLGATALAQALKLTGMFGTIGTAMIETLPAAAFFIYGAYWLCWLIFPADKDFLPVQLSPERRREGRWLGTVFGCVRGVELLMAAGLNAQAQTLAARAVLSYPLILVSAYVLFRLSQLLVKSAHDEEHHADQSSSFKANLITLVGRAAMVLALVGPVLASIGYIPAATALIYPAVISLGLMGLLYVLQMLVLEIYIAITDNEDAASKALLPVLVGFALVLLALPVFALIWGARLADLTELWAQAREGFQLGNTRISPSSFLILLVLFVGGYSATRLFQGALRTTILPRTSIDSGAQKSLISGVGYVGIFLSALVAIRAAGIDLTGFAMVASALSVGIGFGMQNIVSNFVSGIILLIERPISEGDWIEVGGVQGTVRSISVRSTRIQTFDRQFVIVPNTDLVAGRVTNWTRFNLTGRLIVPVSVAYGTDTRKVARVLQEIAEAQPLAILNPPPVITFQGFGPDAMNFDIRIILRDVNFSGSVKTEINHQIVERFAQEGIEIPFTQSEVSLRNASEIVELLRSLPSDPQPKAGQVQP